MNGKNDYICAWGNCEEQGMLPLILSDKTEDPPRRLRFCGHAHATLWLYRQCERNGRISDSAILASAGIVRLTGPEVKA